MRHLFFLLFLLSGFSIQLSGQNPARLVKMNQKEGDMKIYFADESKGKIVREEGQVHDSLRVGEWITYTMDGNISARTNYANGFLDGPFTRYDRNGNIVAKGNYLKGIKTGEWYTYYSDGKVASHGNFVNGKTIGVQETFSTEGIIQTYTNFDSTQTGKSYRYLPDGRIYKIDTYLNAKRNGKQYFYSYDKPLTPDDTLPNDISEYKNGSQVGEHLVYRHKQLIKKETYVDGNLNGPSVTWETTGLLKDSTFYKDGKINGTVYKYDHGILSQTSTYENGRMKGADIHYYKNGKPKNITWLNSGYSSDSSATCYRNGQIKEKIIYNIDIRHYYEYDSLGRLTSESMFNRNMEPLRKSNSFYENGNLKSSTTYMDSHAIDSLKVWSEKKVQVLALKLKYDSAGVGTAEPIVHSDLGKLLVKGSPEYNLQVKKYLPKEYIFTEETGTVICIYHAPGILIGEMDYAPVVERQVDQMPDTNPEEVFTYAEVMPSFPGGESEFYKYLTANMKYPQMEKEAEKQGTVYISFTVEKDGSITEVRAVKEVNGAPGFTKEAIRLISQMPKWEPAKMNGRAVRITVTHPVKFVLK